MVGKPILQSIILLVVSGASINLYAQTKVSEPIYQSLSKGLSKDSASVLYAMEPEFAPLQVESSSPKQSPVEVKKLPTEAKKLSTEKQFNGIPSAFISLGNRKPTYGIVVEKK